MHVRIYTSIIPPSMLLVWGYSSAVVTNLFMARIAMHSKQRSAIVRFKRRCLVPRM